MNSELWGILFWKGRDMKRCAFVLASILLCVSLVSGQPAKSRIRGTSLGDWMTSYWSWALGAEQEGSRKRIVFLPIPQGEPSEQDPPAESAGTRSSSGCLPA